MYKISKLIALAIIGLLAPQISSLTFITNKTGEDLSYNTVKNSSPKRSLPNGTTVGVKSDSCYIRIYNKQNPDSLRSQYPINSKATEQLHIIKDQTIGYKFIPKPRLDQLTKDRPAVSNGRRKPTRHLPLKIDTHEVINTELFQGDVNPIIENTSNANSENPNTGIQTSDETNSDNVLDLPENSIPKEEIVQEDPDKITPAEIAQALVLSVISPNAAQSNDVIQQILSKRNIAPKKVQSPPKPRSSYFTKKKLASALGVGALTAATVCYTVWFLRKLSRSVNF